MEIVSIAELRHIEAALTALERAGVFDKLDGPDRAEYEADLATATAQMRSPRPQRAVLKSVLRGRAAFATAVGAEVVANQLNGLL